MAKKDNTAICHYSVRPIYLLLEHLALVGGTALAISAAILIYNKTSPNGWLALVLVGFSLLYAPWPSILSPASMKAYKDGLEIKGLGIWPWENLQVAFRGESLFLVLFLGDQQFQSFSRPHGAQRCDYDANENAMVVVYNYSRRVTNVTPAEFYNVIKPYLPPIKNLSPAVQRESRSGAAINKAFFGQENPAQKTIAAYLFLYAFLGMTLFYLFGGIIYVPSPAFDALGILFIIAAAIYTLVRFLYKKIRRAASSRRPVLKMTRTQKILLTLMTPILFPLTLVILIIHGPGAAITSAFGTPYNYVIFVPDKSQSISSDCGHKIKSPQLEKSFLNSLCIKTEIYDQLPQSGIITVTGKKSWFGRTIKRYGIPEDPSLHHRAQQDYKEIYQEWGVSRRHLIDEKL